MMLDNTIASELRSLEYAERIARVSALLCNREWSNEAEAHLQYFLAHAQRSLGKVTEALQTCVEALALEMSEVRRATILECLGLCQYDMGDMAGVATTCRQLAEFDLPDSVRAHWLMLRGRLALRDRNPEGFALFADAERIFADLGYGYEQSQAWAQLSAARLGVLLEEYEHALDAAKRVSYPPYRIKATLIQGEVLLQQGDSNAAIAMVEDAMGKYTINDDVDEARAMYIRAAGSIQQGDTFRGAVLRHKAEQLAAGASQRDLELIDAIHKLRRRNVGRLVMGAEGR